MPLRLLLALTLLLGLAACASGDDGYDGIDFKTCGVRPHAVLPVEYRNRVPVVQASIKGQPTSMILDTGATGMVLTEAALKRLGLGTDANRLFTNQGVGGQTRSFAGKLVDFEIDGMHVPDHPVSVLPNNTEMASHSQVDGLFGGDVLANFEVDLDLPHRRVTLYAGRLCPTTVLPPWTVPYETLDAGGSANLRFVVPVELDGRKLTALIDTGAANSIVSADVAQALGVTTEMLQQGTHTRLVGTGPEAATAYVHRFHQIRLGDDTYQGPLLLVTERPDPRVDMIIGEDYLIQHHLWLSYATKRVYIERGGTPNAGS
jgi:predicted aspartyl protease